jgi:DNA-binding NtrC family response regulator
MTITGMAAVPANIAKPTPTVGIVEDDPIMGESLLQRLQLEGYHPIWWQSGAEALDQIPTAGCRVLICDVRLPEMDGEQLFRRALPELGATPVIFITAFGEVEQAVRLMRAGADDYVTKPFAVEALLDKIAALCTRGAVAGNTVPGHRMLSASSAMRGVEAELIRVQEAGTPVLLLGETGVGKEVAARQLHESSARRDQPFIVVNCATLPLDRAESEVFGHERGGIAWARTAHMGLVERAGVGTLYLDELSALPLPLQAKFLRLLEDGSYRRLGGTDDLVSQARVISSSNVDLSARVAEGRFRADLYYRLNATELRIPPLRNRREDIVSLTENFLVELARKEARRPPILAPAAITALNQHAWPGNIRELRNRVERAFGLSADVPQIAAMALFPEQGLRQDAAERVPGLAEARERAERMHIEEALRLTGGNMSKAAALLSVSRTTLWEKMRKLEL